MGSPADSQIQATEQVDRAAKALYEEIRRPWMRRPWGWDQVTEVSKEIWRGHVRNLVRSGAIGLPLRPPIDRPMKGQLSIDD